MEQVLHGSNAILVTFQIYQLLEFYRSTIQQLMHAEAQLLTTLVQLRDTAAGGVRSHMRAQTDRLKRGTVQLPGDLSCPPAVTEIVSQLVQVAGVYESDLQGAFLYSCMIGVCMCAMHCHSPGWGCIKSALLHKLTQKIQHFAQTV